jgi:hypothetical protein
MSCVLQKREKKWEYNEAVNQLFLRLQETYFSVRREVLYNILTEFAISLIRVRINKNVS